MAHILVNERASSVGLGIAVPTLILNFAPRWLALVGLALALISELGFFSLLLPAVSILLPIGRFLGLLWLIAIGFVLPRTRHNREES